MTPSTKSIGDLDFNKIWTTNAEKDRNTSLVIGVYNGRASMSVFSGTGGPPKARIALTAAPHVIVQNAFTHLRKTGPDSKVTIPIRDWNPTEKKMVNLASVTFGFDSSNEPYIGLSAPGMEPTKFPIRNNLKWDISGVAEFNQTAVAVDTFIETLKSLSVASLLSNFKYDPSQGQRGGNNSGRGGNYAGPRQAPTSSSAIDMSDEIPF